MRYPLSTTLVVSRTVNPSIVTKIPTERRQLFYVLQLDDNFVRYLLKKKKKKQILEL